MNLPLGSPTIKPVINVTDVAQAIQPTHGIVAIELCNLSNNDVYFGDKDVTSATGIPIFSGGVSKIWEGVCSNFIVYLICESGKTAQLRRVDYV